MGNEKQTEDAKPPTGNSAQNNKSNKGGFKNRRKKMNRKKNIQVKVKTSTFKGSIDDMNGHVFECYGEANSTTQFARTCEELESYATLKYKYGSDIQYMIKYQINYKITEPPEPDDMTNASKKRIWEKKIDQYVERESKYEQNRTNLYSVIWAQCSSAMQSKLKTIDSWEDIEIKRNCLKLLLEIKGIAYKFESQGYIYLSLDDAKDEFYSYRQGKSESNADYLTKFKSMLEVINHYGGYFGNDPALVRAEMKRENMNVTRKSYPGNVEYDSMIDKAKHRASALAFIKRADPTRYRKLLIELANNFTRGNDQYPADMTIAYNLLINYKTEKKQTHPKYGTISDSDDDDVSFLNFHDIKCYNCNEMGHISRDCPKPQRRRKTDTEPESSPGQSAVQMLITAANVDNDDDDDSNDGSDFDFSFHVTNELQPTQKMTKDQHVILTQHGKLNKNWILLDSQSTVSIFASKHLVKDIRPCDLGESVRCFCNGGYQDTDEKATLKGFGDVYYNPNSIANILSLAQVAKQYPITFDSTTEDAFIVHKKDGSVIKFIKSNKGLYYYDVRKGAKSGLLLLNSADDNEALFSKRQLKRAKLAMKIYGMVGRPGYKSFKQMIHSNMLKNCPIVLKDVEIAEKVYGKDIAALQGRTTRQQPAHVPELDIVPLPSDILENHKNVVLCGDIFFMDKLKVFTTISRNIAFTTIEVIKNRKLHATILPCIKRVKNVYRYRGFKTKQLITDDEFKPLKTDLLGIGIVLNSSSANEHVPEVERNIRLIKERIRAAMADLPYKILPNLMKKALLKLQVQWLNMLPRGNGISPTMSPRTIVHGTTPDFNVHCKVPFGSYCHVNDEPSPSNTTTPRTQGAIALNNDGNIQGGYNFLSLATGKELIRRHWIEIPITKDVIKQVETIARHENNLDEDDDVPEQFIFTHQDRTVIVDIEHDNPAYSDDQDEGAEDNNNDDDDNDDDSSDDDSSIESNDDNESDDDDSDTNDVHPGNDTSTDDTIDLDSNDQNISYATNDYTVDNTATPIEDIENDQDLSLEVETIDDEEARADEMIDQEQPSNEPTDTPNDTETTTDDEPRYNLREKRVKDYSHCFAVHHRPQDKFSNRYGYALHVIMTQMSAKKGLRMFGDRAAEAIIKEFKQLHEKNVFKPREFDSLSHEERKKALRAITLISEKRDGKIKGRTVADGRAQREYTDEADAASPTVSIEALLLSCAIDATEKRNVITADISGAFLQADIDEMVTVLFEGTMVDLLIRTDEMYKQYVHTTKSGKKLLYVQLTKAMYGCIKAARLFWENLSTQLVSMGFKINDYDMCVANKMINGKQCTICWHVDDLKISHVDQQVLEDLVDELEVKYGKMTVTRGRKHTYVGIDIIYNDDGTVTIDMIEYLKEAVNEFPEDVTKEVPSPAALYLFEVNDDTPKLPKEKKEIFHRITAKLLFVSRRGRPDIQLTIAFLCTRTTKSDEDDWKKLKRLMQYLNATISLTLTLSADQLAIIKWWVDASYAVHNNMRSHTGATMSIGRGMIYSKSAKQKLNSKSSTEAELIGASDMLGQTLWTLYFLRAQGYDTIKTTLYQDNTSAIALEENGKMSSSQRTRHINIRYFFIKDKVEKDEITIVYCPTEDMVADYFTKPLQGAQFRRFRDMIMGVSRVSSKERVGKGDASDTTDNVNGHGQTDIAKGIETTSKSVSFSDIDESGS